MKSALCLLDSLSSSAISLKAVLIAEKVLADVLNRVLRLVLCELLEGLKKRWHNVLVKVLADRQVGVHGFLLVTGIACLFALIVTGLSS